MGNAQDAARNLAFISYTGAGKTSLVEAFLYTAGVIPSMGAVTSGNTTCDFEPEEMQRQFSISSAVAHFSWKGTTFNVVDTPGGLNFLSEAQMGLQAVDGVVLVLSASMGLRSELEKMWQPISALELPCLIFVNELDKERAAVNPVVEECEHALGIHTVPVTIPVGFEAQLQGVADLVRQRALRSGPDSPKVQEDDLPVDLAPAVAAARKKLVEGVAETDDALVEKYLADGELPEEDVRRGLREGTLSRAFVPVLCGSAVRNIGTAALLDMAVACLPSPAERGARRPLQGTHPHTGEPVTRQATPTDPFSGFVFKTIIDPFVGRLSYLRILSGRLEADSPFLNATRQTKEKGGHLFTIQGKKYTNVPAATAGDIVAVGKLKDTQTGDTVCDDHHPVQYERLPQSKPVLSFALEPKSKADLEKISLGLHKLVEEDPTLEFVRNHETKEMVLSGMGQMHIDVTFEKLRRKYGVEVLIHTPKVPYKETIRKMAQAQGKYKKQTGGHGQYGDCWLQLDPLPRGQGFKFKNKIVGGVIPRNFIPAVEKGVVEALHSGVLAGCPVVDIQVSVYDGSHHPVDSSEMSFKIAASMGFKKAMEQASPVLLEPIMEVEVTTPDDLVGTVIGDLNGRRGRILGITTRGSFQSIKALVPLAEMLKYAPALTSITGGRGTYTMEFSTYEEVPREQAARLIEEQKAAKQAVAH